MLFTRKGDDGTSGLYGCSQRHTKDSPVFDALGTIDELNSLLGVCRSKSTQTLGGVSVPEAIFKIQECLFIIQAELAGAGKAITQEHIDDIEDIIETLEKNIENPNSFVIPGSSELSAFYDYTRAVSRRAERSVISAESHKKLSTTSLAYLNRLSSFLYALARVEATHNGVTESKPLY